MKPISEFQSYVGKKYYSMTVTEILPYLTESDERVLVRCHCDCGTNQVVFLDDLIQGHVVSCKLCNPILRRIHDRSTNDIKGHRFGRLLVIEETPYRHGSYVIWYCKCDCGRYCLSTVSYLIKGLKMTCGKCGYREERSAAACKKYFTDDEKALGLNYFAGMFDRCYNKNYKNYQRYGGRGITICDEWLKDRTQFVKWSLANGFKEGLTIDRIDPNGPYAPWNCRWVDWTTQQNNRTNNHRVKVNGEEHTLSEWARILDINKDRFYCRPDDEVIRSLAMLLKGKKELSPEVYDKFKRERMTCSAVYRRYFGNPDRKIGNDRGNVMLKVCDSNQSCTRWDTYFLLPDGYTQNFYKEHGREATERMIADRLAGKWVER